MNAVRQELIGKHVLMDETQVEIIDETKHTFVVQIDNTTKRILKHQHTFTIDGKIINGKTLVHKPQDRIKTKWQQQPKTLELQ